MDEGVVLRRRTHHRGAADVDILDDLVARRALGDGCGKGVEIDDDPVARADAMLLHRRDMRGVVAPREDPAVHGRVQSLYAAVHPPGQAGGAGYIQTLVPCPAHRLSVAAGHDHLHPATAPPAT